MIMDCHGALRAYGAAIRLPALHQRCSHDLGGLRRLCVAWKVTFPKKLGGSSSSAEVFPTSFVEMVWSTCSRRRLFGHVYQR